MDAYQSKFKIGTKVRIESPEFLEQFMNTWKYHHKLALEQLEYAGRLAEIRKVGFYHGGDVLYDLVGIPGTWHEQCLCADSTSNPRGGAGSEP